MKSENVDNDNSNNKNKNNIRSHWGPVPGSLGTRSWVLGNPFLGPWGPVPGSNNENYNNITSETRRLNKR